jgi:hypothetical protein
MPINKSSTELSMGMSDSYLGHRAMRLGIDFSAYDSSINEILIRIAFEEINNIFVHFPTNRKDMEAIIDHMINTPILLADGYVYKKKHGVNSGSTFTNFIDTIINLGVMRICIEDANIAIDLSKSYFMGDDASLYFEEGVEDSDVKLLSQKLAN